MPPSFYRREAIDKGAIKGARRSNPATHTRLLDPIRTAFAKANGVRPALFSANADGACPTCNGAGVICLDLGIMAGVSTSASPAHPPIALRLVPDARGDRGRPPCSRSGGGGDRRVFQPRMDPDGSLQRVAHGRCPEHMRVERLEHFG